MVELCAHPEGCPNPKHYIEYTAKDGTRSRHYRRHCKPHSNRLARTGSVGPVEIRKKAAAGEGGINKAGYKELYLPNHPLSTKYGKVLEHRAVLYEKIGPGQHKCNWCAKILAWQKDLFVDHWDFDKRNNEPENLLPSCASCNVKRFNKLVRYILEKGIISKEILRSL